MSYCSHCATLPNGLMHKGNRIRELRKARGWSQAHLGELAGGMDKTRIFKLESGATKLTVDDAMRLALVLGVKLDELIGNDDDVKGTAGGFCEDVKPYAAAPNDPLAALERENVYLFRIDTNVLDKAELPLGTIVEVDAGRAACAAVKPLAAVRVRLHPPGNFMKPVSLLRLFVPPRLLITNSSTGNLPSIDMDTDDAHIVGVVVGAHRRFS